MKTSILLILILIFLQSVSAQKSVACNIEASINNQKSSGMSTDRSGTNVRRGAGTNFPVVETLRDPTGFQFHITASQGNWVRIDEVFVWAETERRKLDGWVYAPSLFLIADDNGDDPKKFVSNLYAEPDWTSRLLFPKNSRIDDAVTLQGCRGDWAKVKHKGKVGLLNPNSHCPAIWDEGPCSQGNDF